MKKYLNPCESGTQFCPKLIEIFNGDTFHAAKENSTAQPIKSDYTFIRIIDGKAVIILKSTEISVSAGDIVLTDSKDFSDILSDASYWIIRFNSPSAPPIFEKKEIYSVDFSSEENDLLSKLFDEKEWDEKLFASFCSSVFALYYLELAGKYCRSETPVTPYHREICEAIEYIKTHYDNVGVAELSKMLHISERMFRKIFQRKRVLLPTHIYKRCASGKQRNCSKTRLSQLVKFPTYWGTQASFISASPLKKLSVFRRQPTEKLPQ